MLELAACHADLCATHQLVAVGVAALTDTENVERARIAGRVTRMTRMTEWHNDQKYRMTQ